MWAIWKNVSNMCNTFLMDLEFPDGKPVVPLLISPSVTPWLYAGGPGTAPPRNPALRVIKYKDHESRIHLTDYDQYYLDLMRANKFPNNVTWSKEYTFTSYDGAENASAVALHAVLNNFGKDGNDDFKKYIDWNTVLINKAEDRPEGKNYVCDVRCKRVHMCSIQHVDSEEYKMCLDLKSGVSGLHRIAPVYLLSLLLTIKKIFV